MFLSNCTIGAYTEEPVATCSVINLQYAQKRLYIYPPTSVSKCHGIWSNLQCDFNTTVTYQCGDEYNLLGPSVTTCVAQNTWFPPPGRCVHKSGIQFLFSSIQLRGREIKYLIIKESISLKFRLIFME